MVTLLIRDIDSGSEATADVSPGLVTVGSDSTNDIVLEFDGVAGHHCELEGDGAEWIVRDYATTSGTLVGNKRVQGEAAWRVGQELRIGRCVLTLVEEAPEELPAPEPDPISTPAPRPVVDRAAVAYKAKIREYLVDHPDVKRLIHAAPDDAKMRDSLKRLIREAAATIDLPRPKGLSEASLDGEMVDEILGLGPIEDLMRDESITEVMVNHWDNILIERAGRGIERAERTFLDEDHLVETIRRMLAPLGRHLNESSPLVDARLKDGTRINAVIPPVAISGAVLTLRKFSKQPFTMEKLVGLGSLPPTAAELLRTAVRMRLNMVVSGGTGTGKTSFLNALAALIPGHERMVVIEDTHELRFDAHPNCVYLEARPANLEGKNAIPIRRLVINALRMRPDRIIVGECRGDETFDMLQAMNTGHMGSMTTVHANSPRDALMRIENMTLMAGYELPAQAIRTQVVSALNIVVQLSRCGSKGERRVSSIAEIGGMEGSTPTMQDLYRLDGTRLAPTGAVPRFLQKVDQRERTRLIHAFGMN
jgi:pilus assembly protein CpaF